MAYVNGLFHGIPAVYAVVPRQQKRRTATNIMAGCFDPRPIFAAEYDMTRRDPSTSRTTPVTAPTLLPDLDPVPTALDVPAPPDARRPNAKKGRVSAPKKPRKLVPVTRTPDTSVAPAKPKGAKHAVPEEKENEDAVMSDGESSESLSPPPPSPTHARPDSGPADLLATRHKASGFWRARSSNASDAPTLKRKRSSLPPNDPQPSSPTTETQRAKRPRLSETTASEDRPRVFYSTSPSLDSSGSLTSVVSEPLELPEVPDSYAESVGEQVPPLLPAAEVTKEPQTQPPARKRGVRRNVALRKGWKGWVEDDLEPTKLILLDKPEVLPERTTRSGRKID